MLLLAHAGHVLLDSLVYGGPVVVVAGAVFAFVRLEGRLAPGATAADEPAREDGGPGAR